MVICAAVGCGSNFDTSKELNIHLYWLPREEVLKIAWKQKLQQEKLPAYENIRVCNLHFEEECFERDLQVYSIYMFINIYPIILANLASKVWLNYSDVTLNFVTVHVFLITEAGTKVLLHHSYTPCLVKNLRKYLWKKEFIINKVVNWMPAALLKKNFFTGNIWVQLKYYLSFCSTFTIITVIFYQKNRKYQKQNFTYFINWSPFYTQIT